MTGVATFHCRALKCWLTRTACADKHATLVAAARTVLGREGHVGAQCVSCELGAQHRAGAEPEQWPDGALVELRVLTPGRSSTSAPLVQERPDPTTSSPPKHVTDRAAPRPAVTAPRSEEPSRPKVSPHTSRGGMAPRVAVPTRSPSAPVRSSTGVTRHENQSAPVEGGGGVPGAGPGARAAEQSAVERPGSGSPESAPAGGARRAPIKPRVCVDCERTYQPTGSRQQRCPECGLLWRRERVRRNDAEAVAAARPRDLVDAAFAEASRSPVSPQGAGAMRNRAEAREASTAAEPAPKKRPSARRGRPPSVPLRGPLPASGPTPVRFHGASADRKLSPVGLFDVGSQRLRPVPVGPYCAATYASIEATCPDTCRFKTSGCYVRAGFTAIAAQQLDAGARGLSGEDVIDAEVRVLDRAFAGRAVPQDGARGGRDLRLHVGGDVPSIAGTQRLAAAVARWRRRGGGAAWTYTHRWARVPRTAFGPISALASVETVEEARRASLRGYVPALVVDRFPSERAFELEGLALRVIPCPAETRGVTCVTCRLCLDDRRLRRIGAAIAFALHGRRADRVRLPVLPARAA